MPAKGEGPAEEWYVPDQWETGAAWVAYPDEGMQRASAALSVDGDVWVVDPVDTPELDELLADFGEVAGVVVLLDRHYRDAGEVADRHDVAVHVPDFFGAVPDDLDAPVERLRDRLPDTDFRLRTVVDNRLWKEASLFDGETLVVPEALGTAEYFAPGENELGVHPVLRMTPPRSTLGGLGPERVVVGHGGPVVEDAPQALSTALARSRRGAPKSWLTMAAGLIGG